MRRPKPLLPWYQQTLFQYLAATLGSVCDRVVLVGQGREEYSGWQVIPDLIPGTGPLGGIAAALRYGLDAFEGSSPWRVILSCDCPFVEERVLRDLVAAATDEFDAVVPRTPDGQIHPLCSIWHARLGDPLSEHLRLQVSDPSVGRSGLGVQRFLRLNRMKTIPAAENTLRNLNSIQDYLAALAELRRVREARTDDPAAET